MVYTVNLLLLLNFFLMKKDALQPILEQAGKTVLEVGQSISQQYVFSNVLKRHSKLILFVLAGILVAIIDVAIRLLDYLKNLDIEKVVSDHPFLILCFAISLLLFVWLKTESAIRR